MKLIENVNKMKFEERSWGFWRVVAF